MIIFLQQIYLKLHSDQITGSGVNVTSLQMSSQIDIYIPILCHKYECEGREDGSFFHLK